MNHQGSGSLAFYMDESEFIFCRFFFFMHESFTCKLQHIIL